MTSERRDIFWKKFPGLVWSNSKASDSVMIMAALTRPRFHEILAICEEFGLERVEREFAIVKDEVASPVLISMVSGMLDNINKGFQRAQARNSKSLAAIAGAT